MVTGKALAILCRSPRPPRRPTTPVPHPLPTSLSEHAILWRELPWPLPWEQIFGRRAPLALEIGFGNGAFLEEQALAHPERDHVGVEVSWTAATHLFRRIHKRGLTNVRVLVADADVVLGLLFAPASIDEVFVNHPCPWPKARHEERRLIRPPFVSLMANRMKPGAPFLLVTDHDDYAAWATEVLEGQDALTSRHATTEITSIPGRTPTKYERKALDRGESIHYFEWKKVREPDSVPAQPQHDPYFAEEPSLGSAEETDSMPTVVLSGGPADEVMFDGYTPSTYQKTHAGVHTVVKLDAIYKELGRPVWLIDTLVLEDKLRQEFALQVVRLPSKELLIKLAAPGRPHPTHGAKRAVWLLGEWLREKHPSFSLVRQTVGENAAKPVLTAESAAKSAS